MLLTIKRRHHIIFINLRFLRKSQKVLPFFARFLLFKNPSIKRIPPVAILTDTIILYFILLKPQRNTW